MKLTMRLSPLLLTYLLSACSSVSLIQENINDQHLEADARYTALVQAIKVQSTLPAITELRQVTVLTDGFREDSVNEQAVNQQLFEAIEVNNWAVCLHKANEALASHYASLNSHYAAMVCRLESGESLQSQYHETVLNLLLESVWSTGDGESINSAFQVMNTVERNAFIEFHGLEFIKHSLTRRDGQDYDVVTIYDAKKDDTFEWYFTELK
ncbi:MAG: hypothetical protein HN475_07585 [Piscirickettsiaceae bacterium]|jgi:hypothetical protein|nr:hypothetical protein [Piscirickettsiaceae bacterium]